MSRGTRKNYLFLNFAIPDEEMEKVFSMDNLPQVQTHKFNWNLIKGLEFIDEFDITYISSRPVSDYPVFPQKKSKEINGLSILLIKRLKCKRFLS